MNKHWVYKLTYTYNIKQSLLICLIIFSLISGASSQGYFQQEVNYKIDVSLNDRLHELNAFESIQYINHSPDTLRFLYFHLWPNGYSENNTELGRQIIMLRGKERLFNDPDLKGYIDSLNFKVDGHIVTWALLPGQPDICKIYLAKCLLKGDTIKITTPFHVKIPKGVTSRLGHIGQSYQISQWYPKPAVYDNTGWHQMSYQDQGEFYSEFGMFDISITLPSNYIVGATGNLQNDKELAMLDQLAADTAWMLSLSKKEPGIPESSEKLKTLRFTQNQIHDFAWFADKRFHVMKGKVKLPDSGREVTTWAMFTNQQAELWKNAIHYVDQAIWYFSKWNGDYPYQTFTAVHSAISAGDGMEYPGITVIGDIKVAYILDDVIAHEIAHSWFYSALGSDERRYPFMDEGITTAYEVRYLTERYPEQKLWEVYVHNKKLARIFNFDKMPVRLVQELQWLVQARNNLEQPINLPAADYSSLNYSLIIYYKAALGFNYLSAYLGDSVFDSIMHDYYFKWKYKHPQPEDLQNVFESHINKDLTWFFRDYLGTTKRIIYEIVSLKNRQILIKNKGEMKSPFVISGMQGDSTCFEKWVDGFADQRWIDIPEGTYSEIKIDPMHFMPELYRFHNTIRTDGIFRKASPIKPQLLYTIENPDQRSLIYIPSIDWNNENGFMVGMTFHNGFLLPKPIEYFMMPFYSFINPGLYGYGKITLHIVPYKALFRIVTITFESTKFGAPVNQNYYLEKIGIELYFKTIQIINPLNQKVFGSIMAASDLSQFDLQEKSKLNFYMQIGYKLEKVRLVNPYSFLVSAEENSSYQKASAEFNYRYSFNGKNQGLDMRLFTGIILTDHSNVPFYAFSASARSGPELYLYQGFYPDRFSRFPSTFWSREMTVIDGGLICVPKDSLRFSQRIISISCTSNLPGRAGILPVKLFADFLWSDPLARQFTSQFFEAGFKAGIWNFFEIYFPFPISGNLRSINRSFKDGIRFVINLESINKIKLNSSFF